MNVHSARDLSEQFRGNTAEASREGLNLAAGFLNMISLRPHPLCTLCARRANLMGALGKRRTTKRDNLGLSNDDLMQMMLGQIWRTERRGVLLYMLRITRKSKRFNIWPPRP